MTVLGAAGLLAGVACLPDLAAFPEEPEAGIEPAPPAASYCGDGVIETLEDGGAAAEECDPGDASTSTAGCESCRITCAGKPDPDTGHCYFFADPKDSYKGALDACRGARAHVVTIGSDREARFIDAFVGALDAGPYWLGLAERLDLDDNYWTDPGSGEPGWPNAGGVCSGCFARTDDAGAFPPERASLDAGPTTCLVSGSGVWLAAPCNGPKRPTLCEREPLGSRLEPRGGALSMTLVLPDAGAKRYVVWPSAVTAADALKTCAASGGSLVMFDSREEREALARELEQRLGSESLRTGIWIGLSRSGDTWAWDDDAGNRPSPWGDSQPSGQGTRAFIVIDENRYDTQLAQTDEGAPSNEKRAFVCQQRPQ